MSCLPLLTVISSISDSDNRWSSAQPGVSALQGMSLILQLPPRPKLTQLNSLLGLSSPPLLNESRMHSFLLWYVSRFYKLCAILISLQIWLIASSARFLILLRQVKSSLCSLLVCATIAMHALLILIIFTARAVQQHPHSSLVNHRFRYFVDQRSPHRPASVACAVHI
jgi:hypothetical protein